MSGAAVNVSIIDLATHTHFVLQPATAAASSQFIEEGDEWFGSDLMVSGSTNLRTERKLASFWWIR